MSRRKQSKPRALKRELGEEDEEDDVAMATDGPKDPGGPQPAADTGCDEQMSLPDDTAILMTSTSSLDPDEEASLPTEVPMVTARGEEEEEEEEYRCETCDSIFHSLTEFMDHRNYDCLTECELRWQSPQFSPSPSQTSSSCSLEGSRSPGLTSLDSPGSPPPADLTPDQLPFAVGADESHPYPCQFCDKAFTRLSHLKKHEQVHSDQMPYKCTFCCRLFKHKRSRDRHVKLHTGDKKYRCLHCDSAFARSDHLKIHLKTHDNGKPFQCTTCNRGYTTAAALTSHMLSHKKMELDSASNEGTSQEVTCLQCCDMFDSVEELHVHIETHHADVLSPASPQSKALHCMYCDETCFNREALDLHLQQDHTHEVQNKCPVDGAQFANGEDLFEHMKTHDTIVMEDCSLGMSVPTTIKNEASPIGPTAPIPVDVSSGSLKFDCPYCNKKNYPSAEVLEIHIRTMHEGKPSPFYTCPLCSAVYTSQLSLQAHFKLDHQDVFAGIDLKLACDYCPAEFTNPETLQIHKESAHSNKSGNDLKEGKIMYTQPHVAISSMTSSPDLVQSQQCLNLSLNSTTVNSISTSSSPTAPKKSSSVKAKPKASSISMSNSEILRSLQQSPKPINSFQTSSTESLTCDHCNATFLDTKSYQVHMKNHLDNTLTKYTCNKCKAEFASEEQLETHVFIHFLALTTEYGCTSCLKLFGKPDELQKHLMDIHAHHLYRCSLCKEIFDSKVNIQVHFAVKHSNECKLYKCTTCGSVFRSEMEWQLHVKVHHLGISKPYRCLFCKDSFGTEVELQCHLTTHKKQFPCPLCEEAFHVEYLLDKHLQTAHSPDTHSPKVKKERDVQGEAIDYSLSPGAGSLKVTLTSSQLSPANSSHSHSSSIPGPMASTASLLSPTLPLNHNTSSLSSPPQTKKGDLIHKCDICDVKFSDESTLQKHRSHDHSISPEMNLMMQKAQAVAQQQKQQQLSPKSAQPSSDKFSQLCVYCNQTFKTKGELEKHMKSHVTPSNQKCNICDEVFPSASILAEHKLQHCKVIKGNVCVVCKVAMKNEEQFYTHAQQHGFQGANMQCIVCRQTLTSMLELQMHGKHHFQNPASFYTCCVCLKTFDSKENLVSKLNSSGRSYYVCKPCYHGENHPEFRCSTCSVKFENQAQLDTHSLQHKKTFQCIKCQQSFATEYEIQLHVATHVMQEGNIHECKLCNSIFDSPAKLQIHLIEHTFEGSEVRCYVCNALFSQASAIQMHVLEHGVGARSYACTHCPQSFFFSAELQNHLYTAHGLQPSVDHARDFPCPDCTKTFPTAGSLSSHRKCHDKKDVATLKCTLCPETFQGMAELQHHFFLSHADVEAAEKLQKTVTCPVCHKDYASPAGLQAHMKVHNSGSKHSCKLCGKEFKEARNLAGHMKSHSMDKPFECEVCHRRFSRKENRKAHMRSHSGIKPFLCPICGKTFSRKGHVKDHMKLHFQQSNIHSCDLCSETFGQLKHLKHHLVTAHHNQAECACRLCGDKFADLQTLQEHLQEMHGASMDDDSYTKSDSVTSRDSVTPGDTDVDMEDVGENTSQLDIVAFHNGREHPNSDLEDTNGMSTDHMIDHKMVAASPSRFDSGVTVVTNPPEQVTVS